MPAALSKQHEAHLVIGAAESEVLQVNAEGVWASMDTTRSGVSSAPNEFTVSRQIPATSVPRSVIC